MSYCQFERSLELLPVNDKKPLDYARGDKPITPIFIKKPYFSAGSLSGEIRYNWGDT